MKIYIVGNVLETYSELRSCGNGKKVVSDQKKFIRDFCKWTESQRIWTQKHQYY